MSVSSSIVSSPDDVRAHNPPRITPLEMQENYYDSRMECDWVKYERSNNNSLVQNIAFALFGIPSEAGELVANANGSPNANARPEEVNLQGYTSRQKEQVMRIYQKLREQGKYSLNDGDILMSVILVVCCRPYPLEFYEIEPTDYWWDIQNRTDVNVWFTAVFKVRKCTPQFDGPRGCCIYVDAAARVYQTWESYLSNNTQPKCVLVVPKYGEYPRRCLETQQRMVLKVSVVPSPALGPTAKVLSAVDTTSALASVVVAAGVVLAPAAPVVLAGATVTTAAVGLYGMFRSSLDLRDRRRHEQSISLMNDEARGSWINILASTVSLSGSAANTLLSRSAAAGTNKTKTGLILESSVDILRYANMATGGIGAANSLALIVTRYKHGETPSRLELFQFTASTLFFANALMSKRTAQSIIEEAQNKTIDQYRETLSSTTDRQKFDRKRETTRQTQGGAITGDTEVIRCIRNISDKDQYFNDVLRTNREPKMFRAKLTSDGHLQFESEPKTKSTLEWIIDIGNFLYKVGIVENILKKILGTESSTSFPMGGRDGSSDNDNSIVIRPAEIVRFGSMLLGLTGFEVGSVADILQELSTDLHGALLTVSVRVLDAIVPEQLAKLRMLSPEKDLIVQVLEIVFNYMNQQRPLGEPSTSTDSGIGTVLMGFFQDGEVRGESIDILTRQVDDNIREQMEERSRRYPNRREITCESCNGIRYA